MKNELLVPCPFKAGSYCSEVCPNFYDNLVVTAGIASESDISFSEIVKNILKDSASELSVYRMKIKHPELSTLCMNATKN